MQYISGLKLIRFSCVNYSTGTVMVLGKLLLAKQIELYCMTLYQLLADYTHIIIYI